ARVWRARSARARWGRACRQLAPHSHVLFFAERTRGEPPPHVRDGSARADSSPHPRTYSFLRSARAGNLLRTCTMGARVPVTRPARARTYYKTSRRHVFRFRQTKKQSRKEKDSYTGHFLFLLCLFF